MAEQFKEKKTLEERELQEGELQEEQEINEPLPHLQNVERRFVELEGEEDRPITENISYIPEPVESIPVDERIRAIPLIPRATPEEVMFLGEYEPPEFPAFDFWSKYGMLLPPE